MCRSGCFSIRFFPVKNRGQKPINMRFGGGGTKVFAHEPYLPTYLDTYSLRGVFVNWKGSPGGRVDKRLFLLKLEFCLGGFFSLSVKILFPFSGDRKWTDGIGRGCGL